MDIVWEEDDIRDYIREYLTDYNDDFVGEPCSEIIQEVLECVQSMLADGTTTDVIMAIQTVCTNMFD